jgi:hypothetical protein
MFKHTHACICQTEKAMNKINNLIKMTNNDTIIQYIKTNVDVVISETFFIVQIIEQKLLKSSNIEKKLL